MNNEPGERQAYEMAAARRTDYVIFDERTGGFYRDIYKIRSVSLLNDFKNIPGKGRLNGVDNNNAFVNVGS